MLFRNLLLFPGKFSYKCWVMFAGCPYFEQVMIVYSKFVYVWTIEFQRNEYFLNRFGNSKHRYKFCTFSVYNLSYHPMKNMYYLFYWARSVMKFCNPKFFAVFILRIKRCGNKHSLNHGRDIHQSNIIAWILITH